MGLGRKLQRPAGANLCSAAKVRNPYFPEFAMLAKVTAKNQLTLPKAITQAVGPAEYFEIEARDGRIVLTPVRIQRGDAVRAKLAELKLTEADVADAVAWARGR
jgi:bifunctional DNA-binding transcriptional regulator/antitoxin component of YhaV-PrlF toxin-antitoxin module